MQATIVLLHSAVSVSGAGGDLPRDDRMLLLRPRVNLREHSSSALHAAQGVFVTEAGKKGSANHELR